MKDNIVDVKVNVAASVNINELSAQTFKGINKILYLLFPDKMRENHRRMVLSMAQDNYDTSLILAGDGNYDPIENKVLVNKKNVKELLSDGELENTLKCLIHYANNLTSENIESDIDLDFLFKWKDISKTIATKNMQVLWGKLLSMEYENPNTISLRSMDVLRNLRKEEALAFQNAFDYMINDSTLVFYDTKEIKKIFDANLLIDQTPTERGIGFAIFEINGVKQEGYYIKFQNHLLSILLKNTNAIKSQLNKPTIKIKTVSLTFAGSELSKAIRPKSPDLVKIACEIKKQNKNIQKINISEFETGKEINGIPLFKLIGDIQSIN
ncbi:TPA: DUF2806 domain-containing protein [Salmonella enterica]|uniref:DUF2806 domain-containing protein n=1 Tax=Salmonella enterica TaxID=28901 RepID=UPI0009B01F68|nr:DUF2806 domain-containing protein [Salmonella enterica]EBQ5257945.1 DUF2806 domain-containing protein [Salmonella enterica]ECH8885275.1 DUF2806 domain-containing protein [Salmonella enterica subsp. enterica]EDU9620106.1 DUF2806 domain-containing protein [Salmonella enterica subsp. enterica serovar Haifa]ELQ5082830.1 DUF2806 domain-containing protein [Salmonella enterica]